MSIDGGVEIPPHEFIIFLSDGTECFAELPTAIALFPPNAPKQQYATRFRLAESLCFDLYCHNSIIKEAFRIKIHVAHTQSKLECTAFHLHLKFLNKMEKNKAEKRRMEINPRTPSTF